MFPSGYTALFPTIMIVTETPDHFIVEFLGASPSPYQMRSIQRTSLSTEEYFSQFPETGQVPLVGGEVKAESIYIANNLDRDALDKRYNFHKSWLSLNGIIGEVNGPTIGFNKAMASPGWLRNCIVANFQNGSARLKYVSCAMVSPKDWQGIDRVRKKLAETPPILYVASSSTDVQAHVVAGQFANIFLFPGLHETAIGAFLERHSEIITEPLGYVRIHSEKQCDWIDGEPEEAKSIRPDLFLERPDGTCDIGDLKLAKMSDSTLVMGQKKRRRFGAYVSEGVAQLAEYREYFSTPGNREHVKREHGITVNDDPRLLLIVGNLDNFPPKEVAEAARALDPKFSLIDYHTLCGRFVAMKEAPTGRAD